MSREIRREIRREVVSRRKFCRKIFRKKFREKNRDEESYKNLPEIQKSNEMLQTLRSVRTDPNWVPPSIEQATARGDVAVDGETLSIAYHRALVALRRKGVITPCPDWDCLQRECSLTMTIFNPVGEPRISRLFVGGQRELQQYVMELLDGILDFEVYRGKWAYTYHDRMTHYDYQSNIFIDQIDFVIKELRRNPYSRRAVIDVRHAEDVGSEHPACLQHIQFFIRDSKLDCYVLFRSNDACKATFMNCFGLIMLQERIAEILGVTVGKYTHRVNSFHCYEKDFPLLDAYVARIKSGAETTYDYQSDWKEEMESHISDIMDTVKELRYGKGHQC